MDRVPYMGMWVLPGWCLLPGALFTRRARALIGFGGEGQRHLVRVRVGVRVRKL